MVRIDYRRALSRLLNAVSGLRAAGKRHQLSPAVARKRRERGQTLIEFAFAVPILLIVLLLLVDFGLAIDRRQMLQHAVREGARAGAVGANCSTATECVEQIQETTSEPVGVDPGQIDVCYADADGNGFVGNAGDDVQVSANFSYRFTVGGAEMLSVIGASPPTIQMTPSAQMRLERNVPGAAAWRCSS